MLNYIFKSSRKFKLPIEFFHAFGQGLPELGEGIGAYQFVKRVRRTVLFEKRHMTHEHAHSDLSA